MSRALAFMLVLVQRVVQDLLEQLLKKKTVSYFSKLTRAKLTKHQKKKFSQQVALIFLRVKRNQPMFPVNIKKKLQKIQ